MLVGISIALVILCGLYLYGNRSVLPVGKRYEHTHDGYKAVVYVSHDVTAYTTGFLFAGDKIEGKTVAKACAIAMKVVDTTLRAHGRPGTPQKKAEFKSQVFYFMPNKGFKKRAAVDWEGNAKKKPEGMMAYTTSMNKVLKFFEGKRITVLGKSYGQDEALIVIRVGYMNNVAQKGGLAVHELIHEVHLRLWGNRDPDHELWHDSRLHHEGKSLNRVCLDNWLVENAK